MELTGGAATSATQGMGRAVSEPTRGRGEADVGRSASVVGCEAGPRGMQHGPVGAGVGNVALQASREKKRWATGENKTERARLSGKRLPIFQIVFFYLVFNSKPTSNVNQIKFEYTFLIQIKIRNFGMLPKINFTK